MEKTILFVVTYTQSRRHWGMDLNSCLLTDIGYQSDTLVEFLETHVFSLLMLRKQQSPVIILLYKTVNIVIY